MFLHVETIRQINNNKSLYKPEKSEGKYIWWLNPLKTLEIASTVLRNKCLHCPLLGNLTVFPTFKPWFMSVEVRRRALSVAFEGELTGARISSKQQTAHEFYDSPRNGFILHSLA